MRKVNSGSIFRLGRCNGEVLQSVGAERKLLSVSHAVAVGFFCLMHVFSYAGCSTEPRGTMCAGGTMRLFNSPNKKF